MQFLSQHEVQRLLSPFFSPLRNAFYTSFQDMRGHTVDAWGISKARSRASLFHDYVVENIKKLLGEHPRVHCVDVRGMFLCVIDEKVALRFKKLNDKLVSSNHYTQQSLDFVKQQMYLPEMGPTTNLNIGYVIKPYWTGLDGVFITCPLGARNLLWSININDIINNTDNISILPINNDDEDNRQVFPKGQMPTAGEMPPERREEDESGG